MSYNMNDVEKPQSNFVEPGYRFVKFTEPKFVTSTQKGTPGLEVTVVSDSNPNAKFKHTFYLTDKTLPHIKKNFEDMTGEEFKGVFETAQDVLEFFGKKINEKKKLAVKVSGREGNDGRVYATLDLSGFVLDPSNFEERDFTDKEYNKNIRKNTSNTEVASTDSAVLLS